MIKELIIAVLAALIIGASSGFWGGSHFAAIKCTAEKWKADDEALRLLLAGRDAIHALDRETATAATEKLGATAAAYAKLRSDYAAMKKARAMESPLLKGGGAEGDGGLSTLAKTSPTESAVSDFLRTLDPTPPDTLGAPRHEPLCPAADDLPVSHDLFRLYIESYRPLMRADP
jgi:hypothetical protein